MRKLLILCLLANLVPPAYGEIDQKYKQLDLMARYWQPYKQEMDAKQVFPNVTNDSLIFIDGERVDKLPKPDNVEVTRLVITVSRNIAEIHFRTVKAK